MTKATIVQMEAEDPQGEGGDATFALAERRDRFVLEVFFLAILACCVVAAFVEALSYDLVSSRTPFVIMLPLACLIVIQASRMARSEARVGLRGRLSRAWNGTNLQFNKVLLINLTFVLLLVAVVVLGHYPALFLFIFVLIRALARERMKTGLLIAAGTTLAIFLVFEWAFGIDLYRGLIIRHFQGYNDF